MFFRRMFTRKDSNEGDNFTTHNHNHSNNTSSSDGYSADTVINTLAADTNNNKRGDFSSDGSEGIYRTLAPSMSAQARASAHAHQQSAATTIQLTPLWEHILRTRKLPEGLSVVAMFHEFNERLRDPEWQVRQHALRVLVDVLVVMHSKADSYMEPLIPQIVENLGHPAPTVRKGALDCLRVYLSDTAVPDTIMLQILDIGLNTKISVEPYGGRLTCGVMLSLPALVQSTLHTLQRHYIVRSTIDMLVQKMGQVTHQEITLKVLLKLKELLGDAEFEQYMSHGAFREFELLCSVYGLHEKRDGAASGGAVAQHATGKRMSSASSVKWQGSAGKKQPAATTCWHSPPTVNVKQATGNHSQCFEHGKVILETEIKINDDTLTMRILEAKDDESIEGDTHTLKSLEGDDDVVCGRLKSAQSEREAIGIIQLLSDSELESNGKEENAANDDNENSRKKYFSIVTPSTPSRTPKRVTFGGEVVKMRTPDSDANSQTNSHQDQAKAFVQLNGSSESNEDNQTPTSQHDLNTTSKTAALSLEIPNDNTKPLSRPSTAQNTKRSSPTHTTTAISPASSATTISPHSPVKRKDSQNSLSPKSPYRRLSVSPVDSIISPKTVHKEIEVLHNLQRDPSPVYAARISRRQSEVSLEQRSENVEDRAVTVDAGTRMKTTATKQNHPPPPSNWEDLDIVDYETLVELRSGNWRLRLQGILQLEEALRSTENLALVQPCLASLLRTLLSSERNPDVAEAKRRVLVNLITRLPLDNLEDRTVQILTGLCRQGGAGANRVCKSLMQRLPPAVIVVKLISDEFLLAKSSRFRENALQMVIYALITFPSTCFDTSLCISNALHAALNRKRRVRQAALDVLAVLGQIATSRSVIEITQKIAATRDEGPSLLAAIKARLARKQLPLVTPDGAFQYALRVPSPQTVENAMDQQLPLDADIEWITAGVGSVSPTSLKRRAYKHRCSTQQSFCCLSKNEIAAKTLGGSRQFDETFTRFPNELSSNGSSNGHVHEVDMNHTYNMQPIVGGANMNATFGIHNKKSNGDFLNLNSRRLPAKSCSDSSIDGRSSDSTYTNSSGGSIGNGVALTNTTDASGISGRFTRQAVNSRFPAMDRIDLNTTYLRVHKPPVYYPGMGAYAHLQQQQYNMSSTYPKVNYELNPTTQRRRSQQPTYQQQNHHTQPPAQQGKYHSQAKDNFKQIEMQQNEPNNDNENLDGTYTICTGMPAAKGNFKTAQHQQQIQNGGGNNNGRRFVNVEKFIMQSNKSSQTNGNANANTDSNHQQPQQTPTEHTKQTTPASIKSSTYSQKSTASAQTSNTDDSSKEAKPKSSETTLTPVSGKSPTDPNEPACSTPTTTLEGTLNEKGENDEVGSESPTKWSTGAEVLQLEDVVDGELHEAAVTNLNRNDSLISLHSKTESIKTQFEDTPPVLSRTQSNKSLIIEEEIENSVSSFLVVDEDENNTGAEAEVGEEDLDADPEVKSLNAVAHSRHPTPTSAKSRASTRSPTIAELKILSRRNSMIKSMESLYERRAAAKQDSLDNTTETSSQSSQLNASTVTVLPIKPQHTPLKQKSKTTHFLKNSRRISPVKQSIKMSQPELFPATLAKFDRPREALTKTFDQLDSGNWEIIVQGLTSIVRLMRHHAEHLENQMHMVCIQLTRAVRNLRSQVSRAACQASTELFSLKLKTVEQESDDLICALLHRTADTNRFLRADATRGLESMVDHMPAAKVLNVLSTKGAMHSNALVRTTCAKLLHRLVERLGYEKIYQMGREQRDKFFVTGANLLLEGSLETRSHAKSLFRVLSEHPNFNRLLLEVIPPRTYRNVEKTLKNIGR